MEIRTLMFTSLDGYVTTPDGWPVQLAAPSFDPRVSHGLPEFLADCEAALMGRTTFEPALGVEQWPWPNLDVFVLTSRRLAGTPDEVVTDSDPARLLSKIRDSNRGRNVHLVGGPRTVATFHALGALDRLGVVVLPLLVGEGLQLPTSLSAGNGLTLESHRAFPDGSVELTYTPDRR
jgi:dihydrofolate reductase